MRILLVSTYELGHQPLHVASPAAALGAAGHDVRAVDLAVEPLPADLVDWAEAAAVSVPMHTAMRLAVPVARRIRARRPGLPLAFYGLYAAVGADRVVGSVADRAIVGEYEPGLVAWTESLAAGDPQTGVHIDVGRGRFRVPARHLLPGLDRYAHLDTGGEHVLVGYVEASHGCRHRCRHCPLPAVYDGRFRSVGLDTVLADLDQLVGMGARHVTFGDPDFLNAPVYALGVLEEAHAAFPHLTFDLTVKVEHLLDHAARLPDLARLGVLFVVSAFETVSDRVLLILDKGHTAAGMSRAVEECRRHGIDIHPSWLPFTPWTRGEDILGIFRFLDDHDLLGVTDPVQMGIRLLVPEGSLLLPALGPHLGEYDPDGLTYTWASEDPGMDDLQPELASIAARAADRGEEPLPTMLEMWRHALDRLGGDPAEAGIPAGATTGRPRLTEPWFC